MQLGEHDIKRWLLLSQEPALWSWSRTSRNFFDLRMLAIRLTDGRLCIVSPIPHPGEEAFRELDALGKVAFLCAPNHFHNLGLKPFLARYPHARCVASPAAIPRLKKVTGLDFEPFTVLKPFLPHGIEAVEPIGLKAGELWFEVKDHTSGIALLCVCDAFFNMQDAKSPLWSLIFRIGGTMPGLKVSRVFRLLGVSDHKRYKAWIDHRWQTFRPEVLVPAHGDFYSSGQLVEELKDLI